MAQERIQHRLAAMAILDVVCCSRMMETYQAGILARRAAQRKTLIEPIVQLHRVRRRTHFQGRRLSPQLWPMSPNQGLLKRGLFLDVP